MLGRSFLLASLLCSAANATVYQVDVGDALPSGIVGALSSGDSDFDVPESCDGAMAGHAYYDIVSLHNSSEYPVTFPVRLRGFSDTDLQCTTDTKVIVYAGSFDDQHPFSNCAAVYDDTSYGELWDRCSLAPAVTVGPGDMVNVVLTSYQFVEFVYYVGFSSADRIFYSGLEGGF